MKTQREVEEEINDTDVRLVEIDQTIEETEDERVKEQFKIARKGLLEKWSALSWVLD